MSTTTAPTSARLTTARPRRHLLARVLVFSLCVTTTAALVAVLVHAVALSDMRYMVVFIYARWFAIFGLIGVAVALRISPGIRAPAAVRTPLTVLFLTVESIAIDVISAYAL